MKYLIAPYLSLDIETIHLGLGGNPHPVELLLNNSQSFPNICAHSLVLLSSLVSSPIKTQLKLTHY